MDNSPTEQPSRGNGNGASRRSPRTVLVLGGGGAWGVAHVGVVRALERVGLMPDEIVATSMGATLGAGLAAGMTSDELEQLASEVPFEAEPQATLLRAYVEGAHDGTARRTEDYRRLLAARFGAIGFGDLRRRFFCSALSLSTGALRYFGLRDTGEVALADALYASSCRPGLLEPLQIDGESYVDGGLAEALALRIADARRADLILAVDVAGAALRESSPAGTSPADVLQQAYQVLGRIANEHNLHRYANSQNLVLIKPRFDGLLPGDRRSRREVVERGEREAYRALATHSLTRYLLAPDLVKSVDRVIGETRDYVHLHVDPEACINCGVCAVTCVTDGYAAVPVGNVVRKLHHYECTRDGACERTCPTRAISLRNF